MKASAELILMICGFINSYYEIYDSVKISKSFLLWEHVRDTLGKIPAQMQNVVGFYNETKEKTQCFKKGQLSN